MKKEMKLTYKKTKYAYYNNEKQLKFKTQIFHSLFKEHYTENVVVACLDEVGFSSKIKPLYNWYLKGKEIKIKCKINTKERINTSVCSCISNTGSQQYSCLNVPYKTTSLLDFLQIISLPVGSILLMDNVPFHHSKKIIEYIKNQGWILIFTPPYSPWFNPIENIFGMIKNQYRKINDIHKSFSSITSETIIKTINSTVIKILNNFYI